MPQLGGSSGPLALAEAVQVRPRTIGSTVPVACLGSRGGPNRTAPLAWLSIDLPNGELCPVPRGAAVPQCTCRMRRHDLTCELDLDLQPPAQLMIRSPY